MDGRKKAFSLEKEQNLAIWAEKSAEFDGFEGIAKSNKCEEKEQIWAMPMYDMCGCANIEHVRHVWVREYRTKKSYSEEDSTPSAGCTRTHAAEDRKHPAVSERQLCHS